MADVDPEELLHAEIDGELDAGRRGELARYLLANPQVRGLRNELHRLCSVLDAFTQIEPPAELKDRILAALPHPAAVPTRSFWSASRWRYAAVIAGVLVAGALVVETVRGPGPATSEVSGTLAAAPPAATIDSVTLSQGPVAGNISLRRIAGGLTLAFDVRVQSPVDVIVEIDGRTFRVDGLGQDGVAAQRVVSLPGVEMKGQSVALTFLVDGQPTSRAALRVPNSP